MLHSLISDVLDLTTIEDENLELNENKFHLDSEIKDILEIFRPKIDSRKAFLHLHHEHDNSIPKVLYGDISRIRQVLVNLVNNGIKFTNDGSVIIQTKLLKKRRRYRYYSVLGIRYRSWYFQRRSGQTIYKILQNQIG